MLSQPYLQIIAARKFTQMCSVVLQYTKDHLKSIISLPPDWPGNDTTQMILGRMMHRQRVTGQLAGCPGWLKQLLSERESYWRLEAL